MKGGLTVPAKRWKDNLKKLRNNKRNDVRLKIKLYVKNRVKYLFLYRSYESIRASNDTNNVTSMLKGSYAIWHDRFKVSRCFDKKP
jgi:hypothetical protein